MITRSKHRFFPAFCVFGLAIGAAACQKVPLLAPSGSTISLTASNTAVPSNGSVHLIAQVLEPAGTPPHSGTHVIFTTSLGAISPSEVETDINGQARTTFSAGGANGTAIISASSGGASASGNNAIRILVGTAGVGHVIVSANPVVIPASGGTSTITAMVSDINGNALTSAPVAFTTTAGTLDVTSATTDANGVATATLRTSVQATVTASVGATGGQSTTPPTTPPATGGTTTTPTPPAAPTAGQQSGSVTVTVAGAPTLVITPPTTTPSAGLPAAFTFAVTLATTNSSPIRTLSVNWGDGSTTELGAVTGNAVANHTYLSPGSFTITGTLTDSFGTVVSVSTPVSVIATPLPTVNITPSVSNPATGPIPVSFQIQITPPTGLSIQDAVIKYGDGSQDRLGGVSGTVTKTHNYQRGLGQLTVEVDVTDSSGRTTLGTTQIVIP